MKKRTDETVHLRTKIAAGYALILLLVGGMTGFVVLLLLLSYAIIHRNANRIRRYRQETTRLIELTSVIVRDKSRATASNSQENTIETAKWVLPK